MKTIQLAAVAVALMAAACSPSDKPKPTVGALRLDLVCQRDGSALRADRQYAINRLSIDLSNMVLNVNGKPRLYPVNAINNHTLIINDDGEHWMSVNRGDGHWVVTEPGGVRFEGTCTVEPFTNVARKF